MGKIDFGLDFVEAKGRYLYISGIKKRQATLAFFDAARPNQKLIRPRCLVRIASLDGVTQLFDLVVIGLHARLLAFNQARHIHRQIFLTCLL